MVADCKGAVERAAGDPRNEDLSFDVSVVIPAMHEDGLLIGLLQALRVGLERIALRFEILVVAASSSASVENLCRKEGITCVPGDGLTPGQARNLGAGRSRGRWLVFLDADVLPTESWYQRLPEYVRCNEGRLLAGWPVVVPPDHGWVAEVWQDVRIREGGHPSYVNTANMVLPRDLFDELAGFDEALSAGEDVDFCRRAMKARTELRFDPALQVVHYGEPRDVGEFFLRQLFHASSARELLAGSRRSLFDAALVGVGASYCAMFVGAALGPLPTSLAWLVLGPVAAAVASAGKMQQAIGWNLRPPVRWRGMLLCFVMVHARLLGAVLPRKVAPRLWTARKASR